MLWSLGTRFRFVCLMWPNLSTLAESIFNFPSSLNTHWYIRVSEDTYIPQALGYILYHTIHYTVMTWSLWIPRSFAPELRIRSPYSKILEYIFWKTKLCLKNKIWFFLWFTKWWERKIFLDFFLFYCGVDSSSWIFLSSSLSIKLIDWSIHSNF